MVNVIVIFVVAAIIGVAAGYIWKAKKRGVKCIGCPDGATCSGSCGSCSGGCSGCGQSAK